MRTVWLLSLFVVSGFLDDDEYIEWIGERGDEVLVGDEALIGSSTADEFIHIDVEQLFYYQAHPMDSPVQPFDRPWYYRFEEFISLDGKTQFDGIVDPYSLYQARLSIVKICPIYVNSGGEIISTIVASHY